MLADVSVRPPIFYIIVMYVDQKYRIQVPSEHFLSNLSNTNVCRLPKQVNSVVRAFSSTTAAKAGAALTMLSIANQYASESFNGGSITISDVRAWTATAVSDRRKCWSISDNPPPFFPLQLVTYGLHNPAVEGAGWHLALHALRVWRYMPLSRSESACTQIIVLQHGQLSLPSPLSIECLATVLKATGPLPSFCNKNFGLVARIWIRRFIGNDTTKTLHYRCQ